jgi:sugar phosphate isomerase/epimerase
MILTMTAAMVAAGAAASSARTRPRFPIGVQLWTVKDELDRDFDGTLKRLAAIGYRRVEAAGFHGRTAEAFGQAVRRAGLICDSAHVSMPDLQQDLAGRIADARTLGLTYLVCSSPTPARPLGPIRADDGWMGAMGRAMTLDGYRRDADVLNRMGEAAAKAGVQFAYHNHVFDFAKYDGVVAYEELLRLTDPKLVSMELDVGWAIAGGADPVDLLRRHRGRIVLLHLKDLHNLAGPAWTTVPIGQGLIAWGAILRAASAAGVRGAYVEQEPPFTSPVLDALVASRRYLQAL